MNNTEKEELRTEYNLLKAHKKALQSELLGAPKDSPIEYEIRQELSAVIARITDIHRTLLDARFGRFYPTTLINNFFDENINKGGRS